MHWAITGKTNYLTEKELLALNNLVEQYLIFAEGQAMRRIPMHMIGWIQKLDGFLSHNERDILAWNMPEGFFLKWPKIWPRGNM